MQIEELKRIIITQKEELEDLFGKESIIEREIDLERMKNLLKHPNVLVISGVRRSGKSILSMLLLKDKNYGYINFDDERLANFKSDDFEKLVQAFYELYSSNLEYFIFDEIQNIKNWELFINRLRISKKIIITGSNARLLSGELSTYLTGRYIDFILYPFSFKEFLKIKGIKIKKQDFYSTRKIAQIKNLLKEYIKIGGFPEAIKFGSSFLERTYRDIINKDVIFRYNIRHKSAFKELSKYLISNFSQKITYSKLKNIFGIKNIHTVKNYIDYLCTSFLIFSLEKFSFKLKKQFIAPKKVYGIDSGVINSLAFQFSKNLGYLMENIVFLEILRKKSYLDRKIEIYYWEDYLNQEVDFVIKERKKIKQLIQVSHDFQRPEIEEREINGLIKGSRDLNCKNLLVITWDQEKEEKIEGKNIKFIPLWKWLII